MQISIVIPTYLRHDKLKTCLASIINYTNPSDCCVVVVANGAAPEARLVYEEFESKWQGASKLLWFEEPLGYARACNEGIRATDSEYIILLNDDCELLKQSYSKWIDVLLKPFTEDPLTGITGPQKINDENSSEDFLIFFCVMISRDVVRSVGLLDESFGIGFGEDTAYCIEARRLGWKVLQVPDDNHVNELAEIDPNHPTLERWKHDRIWAGNFPLFHDAESTLGRMDNIDELLRRNRALLKERYRAKVQKDLNWRAKTIDGWFGEDEIDWLAEQVRTLPTGARVLECGSWHGRSSRAIADALPEQAQLWCVDTWIGSSGEPEMHGSAHYERGDHAHQWWWCNLQEHINAGRVVPVRMYSDNAAHTIGHLIEKGQMEKFDLIFIDGDHSKEGIKTDVESWLPLLKKDGLLCGHDYYKEGEGPYWVHVRQYVEERFPQVQKAATSIWWVRPHEQQRSRIFDCFLFHNELDVLEIRLATLYDTVDHFVLVEAQETHAGEPKPLHFDLNRERFSKYLDKIRHVVIDKFPEFEGNVYDKAWARERYQRDACMIALEDANPNDVVIIGDADEIPAPAAVAGYKPADGIVRLKQRMFYYYLNCENKEGWDWQKIAPYNLVRQLTPCGIRYPPAGDLPLVENAGWHFSFCGDNEHIAQKIRDYSHREYDTAEVHARIDEARERGIDLFGRDLQYELVITDATFPVCVQEHLDDFVAKGLIKSPVILKGPTEKSNKIDLTKKHWTVTAEVSTKDRYTTTLPLCLSAILNQTRLPDKLVVYDDSEQRISAEQLCQTSPFNGLFQLATSKGIEWSIQSTPRLGQVANHQHALDTATSDFIWRIDDDEIPEPNCLEELLNTIRDFDGGRQMERIGAVGGLVHHPGAVSDLPAGVDGSLNDIASGLNLSWFNWNGGAKRVDHLYSTFLYSVAAARAAGGYPKSLSPIGHREESIFSHSIKRAGYEVLCTPWTKTWHLREESGGIRSNPDPAQWAHDEHEWQRLLKTWDVVQPDTKLIVCDYGLGDTLCFRGVLTELRRRNPERRWVLAVCFPEVFKDMDDVTIISIADAKLLVGNRYNEYSLYKWCWDKNWDKSIVDAMYEFYS